MTHGIQTHFLERRRFARRVSGITLGCAVLFLAAQLASAIGPLRRAADRIPVVRFGYEGRDQYVRRIELKSETGLQAQEIGPQQIPQPRMRRGGAAERARTRDRRALPEVRPRRDREGEANLDQVARAARQLLDVPVVQSEDLIIEHLVKPSYPEDARDKGIEGRVAVLALVDTLGLVASAEVLSSESQEPSLERAATEAVLQCRFRPYQVDGRSRSVYAMFRFAFRIN